MYKAKKNIWKAEFIAVYYSVLDTFKISYEEYLILSLLNMKSKGVEIGTINKSEISDCLNLNRNKVIDVFKIFFKSGIIYLDEKCYYFDHNFIDEFREAYGKGKFCIIYFDYWKQLEINLKEYLMLYLIYSLGLNSNKWVFFNVEYFSKFLQLKRSGTYRTLNALINYDLITKKEFTLELDFRITQSFSNLRTMYKK